MEKISADRLRQMMQGERQPLLLDVRDPYELLEGPGCIDGVLNIPLARLAGRLEEIRKYAEEDVVIICRSGMRAVSAANILAGQGFTRLYVLDGGMLAWK